MRLNDFSFCVKLEGLVIDTSYLHFDKFKRSLTYQDGVHSREKSVKKKINHCAFYSTVQQSYTTYSRMARFSLVQIEDYLLRRLSVRMCLVRPRTIAAIVTSGGRRKKERKKKLKNNNNIQREGLG